MRTFCQYLFENISVAEEAKNAIDIPVEGTSVINAAGLNTKSHGFNGCSWSASIATYNGTAANGKFNIFTVNEEDGRPNGSSQHILYLSSGLLHREDGPAAIEAQDNGKINRIIYAIHGKVVLIDRITSNNLEQDHFDILIGHIIGGITSAMKLGITLLRKYPETICEYIVKDKRHVIPELLRNFKFAKVFLLALLQDECFNDKVSKALNGKIPEELEYDILSKHPHLASKIHQCDQNLIDNIKKLDKKYNLDLAEEIEARIS